MNTSLKTRNLTQGLRRLVQWYQDALLRLRGYSLPDTCQLLLCARELGLDSPLIRHEVERIATMHDPPEQHREHIVQSVLRQLVLMRFDVARDERQGFFDYWIAERNIKGERITTRAYIVGLAIEQSELLHGKNADYARAWFHRHDEIANVRVRAWMPRYLSLLGHDLRAHRVTKDLLSRREPNGSWAGSFNRTAAALYALSRFSGIREYGLDASLFFVLGRLDRGVTGTIELEANTLKAAHTFGLLPETLHASLSGAVAKASPFPGHFSDEAVAEIHAAVISARLDRDALLSGIDVKLVAQLHARPAQTAQILSDLRALNDIASLANGTVPVKTWLTNAMLLSDPREESALFRNRLLRLRGI